MFRISGLGDEISTVFGDQLDLLEAEGIKYIELRRGIDNKNLLKLSNAEAETTKNLLNKRGFSVSAIASSIGKAKITDDFELHLEQFRRILFLAKYFETKYIRIFGYYIAELKEHSRYRDEVIKRLKIETELAEKNGLILSLENEGRDLYGSTLEEMLDIMTTINSPNLRILFDPGNYVYFFQKCPYPEVFNAVVGYIGYIHIKDIKLGEEKFVVAGEGDAGFKHILLDLNKRKFDGFLSLEPHLGEKKGEITGPLNFTRAAKSLKKLLCNV
ncbi:MAG: sugar phosphate isomerase/epimerase family protein [bacterium]|nr:sugar phosphate isomerase/epimerase family protein [bacterium]